MTGKIQLQTLSGPKGLRWSRTLFSVKELGVIGGIVLAAVIFTVLNPQFLSMTEAASIITSAAEIGIIAIGITILMISGEFDLSVGSIYALCPTIWAYLFVQQHWNIWLSLVCALIPAALTGLANGLIVTRFHVNSFIVTLGTQMWWRGIVLVATGGYPISYFGSSKLMHVLGGEVAGGLHFTAVWFVVAAVLGWFVLNKTKFGNWCFASGGKPDAARAMGIPVTRVKVVNFCISALLAGLVGCMDLARLNSVSPAQGQGLELTVIVAAVIGGTALAGGIGSVVGSCLGALLMGMITSGLILMGAPSYWYTSFVGLILIIAVMFNVRVSRISKSRGA